MIEFGCDLFDHDGKLMEHIVVRRGTSYPGGVLPISGHVMTVLPIESLQDYAETVVFTKGVFPAPKTQEEYGAKGGIFNWSEKS